VVTVVGLAVFSSEIAGLLGAGIVTCDGGDVTSGPDGGEPDAVAAFVILPASTSACVTVYVAEQIICPPGANDVVAGQLGADIAPEPLNDPSTTVGLFNVTLPVFVTTNEYVITRPTVNEAASDGDADFTMLIAAAGVIVTFALDGGDVTVPPVGEVPDAVAVFVTFPASTSACVVEYDAVHVTDAPGANDAAPAGQLTADNVPVPENAVSPTDTFANVTLPVFVTTNE
jgi:hypothetical protein